jgi:predicted nuclease of restriction endonuclease-like (RecB) superfamily
LVGYFQSKNMQINPLNNLVGKIETIIDESRLKAIRSVEFERVIMYWKIGEQIKLEEQNGKKRADYGDFLIKKIALKLENKYGSGFSFRQLILFRKFYIEFPIISTLLSQFSWTHYRNLIRIDNLDKRTFYISEAQRSNWTARQLERQVNSQLFERLLVSNNVQSLLSMARKEIVPVDPREIIKDPMVLEFLGLKQEVTYYEKDLESAIIRHLQEFLLEMGNGFSFVQRQKRIHIDGDDFFIDLVFYNRLLQCFVIIEIKTNKISHESIGQLQMYVNYFDRFEKQNFENQTIGILLCADKNDSVVKITLPENNKSIIASKYQLYLPTESQLLDELKKELIRVNKRVITE